MTVSVHRLSAFRTILWRKVKARAVASVGDKLAVLTFWANIVRAKRIDLGNARHCCDKRRAYRASRADKIAVSLAVGNKLLSGHIEHRKAVGGYRIKLLVEPCFYDLGKRVAVFFLCALPGDVNKLLLRSLDIRRKGSLWDRAQGITHIGDLIWIFDNDLVRLILAEPLKFL